MAHFAIQLGNVGIDLEDEDLGAVELIAAGREVLADLVELLDAEDEDEDDD